MEKANIIYFIYDFHGVMVGGEAFLSCEGESEVPDPPHVRRIVGGVVPFHCSLHQLLRPFHRVSARHFVDFPNHDLTQKVVSGFHRGRKTWFDNYEMCITGLGRQIEILSLIRCAGEATSKTASGSKGFG